MLEATSLPIPAMYFQDMTSMGKPPIALGCKGAQIASILEQVSC